MGSLEATLSEVGVMCGYPLKLHRNIQQRIISAAADTAVSGWYGWLPSKACKAKNVHSLTFS